MEISKYFLLFFIYSVIGWLIEVINLYIRTNKFVNRGFLIGPYCPIYGVGGVVITIFLTKYSNSLIVLFVMSAFLCGIIEYFTSYAMEKLFNARWWDYSYRKFNINGRICLETLVPFGILGCVVIYITNPILYNFFDLLNYSLINIIALILLVIFVFDYITSFKIISSFKETTMTFLNRDNTEEITKKVRLILSKKSFLTKRLVDAFPQFKTVISNIKNEFEKTKIELKTTQKQLKNTQKQLKKIEKRMKKNSKKYK